MTKVLVIDIETTPHLVYTWGLFQQNISINQIVEPTRLLCWSGMWHGEQSKPWVVGGPLVAHRDMVVAAWEALDQAQVVIHYNGKSFDVPHLNREFLEAGLPPPSPYQQIDLYRTIKARFRFASNKLDWVSQTLKLGKKHHTNFGLWVGCMDGDQKAWRKMKMYCRHDVALTGELYDGILPWINNHPNVAILEGKDRACVQCGKEGTLVGAGHRFTQSGRYQRYQCSPTKGGCGKYQTEVRREATTELRGESL